MKVAAMGVAWYAEEDWAALKVLFTDSEKLHQNYSDWHKAAEIGFNQLSKQGHVVIKVPLKPREFAHWCHKRGLEPNANARMQYSSEEARDAGRHRPSRLRPLANERST